MICGFGVGKGESWAMGSPSQDKVLRSTISSWVRFGVKSKTRNGIRFVGTSLSLYDRIIDQMLKQKGYHLLLTGC